MKKMSCFMIIMSVIISMFIGVSASTVTSSDIITEAKTWLGTPYVYAGNSRLGVDCSGFTTQVYTKFGIPLPRTSLGQGTDERYPLIPIKNLMPGDLLCFGDTPQTISHVGIYMGGDDVIHSMNSNTGVIISNVSVMKPVLQFGRRLFDSQDTTPPSNDITPPNSNTSPDSSQPGNTNKPTNIKIAINKGNNATYGLGEKVSFNFSIENSQATSLVILKDGLKYNTPIDVSGDTSYEMTFNQVGRYSGYLSGWNTNGYRDSTMANWTVDSNVSVESDENSNDQSTTAPKPHEPGDTGYRNWAKQNNSWFYYDSNGYMVKSKWIGNYYLTADGSMAISRWISNFYVDKDGVCQYNKWVGDYFVDHSGKWVKDQWVKTGDVWYYCGNDGKYVKNVSLVIKAKTYHFGSKGICVNP